MKLLSVDYHGHTYFIAYHRGEPWVPLLPLCKAFALDIPLAVDLTQNDPLFGAQALAIVGLDGIVESVCIPLRKLFGWLVQFVDADQWRGLDDALQAAFDEDQPGKFPGLSGRVMLTMDDGRIDALQYVPDNWLVGPLERFHELATRAGYRVMHEAVHELMYATRI